MENTIYTKSFVQNDAPIYKQDATYKWCNAKFKTRYFNSIFCSPASIKH